MILGKIRSGSLTSSAMFTESSKPTMAKKASVVPAVTATKIDRSSGVSKITTRDRSALPWVMAKKPTKMTISNPLTSTSVSTMLTFTLSATPRKLTTAIRAMKQTAMMVVRPSPASSGVPPIQSWRTTVIIASKFAAKAREAVEADVMPEHITAKAIRKVKKCSPNALCVYSAAPAACGILGDQLEVGAGGDRGHDESDQERQPDHAADLIGDVAGDGIDARPQDVTNDEEQQQLGGPSPVSAQA